MQTVILLQPLFACFTGWFTMWLASYFLFQPREPKRILGFRVQGLLPSVWEQESSRLGAFIAARLQIGDLAAHMKDPAQLAGMMPGIEAHIDAFLQHRLKEKIPVLAMFLSDNILQTIKAGLMEEIEALLPQVISQYADTLGARLDIGQLINTKLKSYTPAKAEALLRARLDGALRRAQWMGAAIGLIIGLLQLGISLCL